MIHIEWLSAVLMLVGTVSTAVLIVANYRKINKETFAASTDLWARTVDALKEHNDALKNRLDDAEAIQLEKEKLLALKQGAIEVLEREKGQLVRRNMLLYERLQTCRTLMSRAGLDSGPEPDATD